MFRNALLGCLALLWLAGCDNLTRVTPPPVPLSALSVQAAPDAGGFPATPAAARVRLLRALSPGSLATLHIPDIAGTQRRFKGTTLYKLFRSPEVRKMLADAGVDVDQLEKMGSIQAQGPGGINFTQLQRALQGEFILSLQELEIRGDAMIPSFRVLGGLSVAGAEHEVQQLLDFLVMAVSNNPKIKVEQGSLNGTGYTRFHVPGPPALIVEIALYRDALLAGVGRDVVTDAIGRLQDETIEALPDEASFGRCMQRVGHTNDVFRVHVDLTGLHARLRDSIPPDAARVLEFLGFEHMKSVAAALSIDGKNLVMKTFLDSPGGKDFVTDMLRRHSADRRLLERVPAGATSFSLFTLDGRVVLNRLRETLRDDDLKQMEDQLAEMNAAGADLENGILPAFGPRFALVTVRAGRRDATGMDALWNQLLGTAFVVEMQDREAALKQMARLPQSNDLLRRSDDKIGTVPVISYRFPREHVPRGFELVMAPVEGYVVLALSRETMEQMLQPPAPETLAHFRNALKNIPETAVALSYDDLSQSNSFLMLAFMEGLNRARSKAGADEGEKIVFPKLSAQGANPSISYTLADEHGVFTQTRSPTGGLTELGGVTGVLAAAGVLFPALAAKRMQANEEDALRAMQAIRNAQAEYRSALVRDADTDGDGENAFLAELLADEHARKGAGNSRALLSDFKRTALGYTRGGYHYRAYLPGEDGSPIGDHHALEQRMAADGDLAETIVVVVAWPTTAGITGNRSFMMLGNGKIYYCDTGYGGTNSPRPDNFSTQEGNLAAAPIGKHQRTRDGLRWIERR